MNYIPFSHSVQNQPEWNKDNFVRHETQRVLEEKGQFHLCGLMIKISYCSLG